VPVLVVLLLAYSAGAWLETGPGVVTVILGFGLIMSCAFLPPGDGTPATAGNIASAVLYSSLEIIPAWFIGRLARDRNRRATAFRQLAAQTAAEQDERDAAAIGEERARIGSELQDIIAHSVSAMVIQAGGARLLLRSHPDRARESILNIEQTGRQSLADLRRLLGMLHKDDDPGALSPQPGLTQVADLLESFRHTGFGCELRTLGDPIDLTPGVDLVAYRVVEAALSSIRSGGGTDGAVTIRYRPHEVRLEIRAYGSIPNLTKTLRSITERVALYDGRLETLDSNGALQVHARLPLEATVPLWASPS
jgi:signal transduction histidine kinase